jgi:hypothetical protein
LLSPCGTRLHDRIGGFIPWTHWVVRTLLHRRCKHKRARLRRVGVHATAAVGRRLEHLWTENRVEKHSHGHFEREGGCTGVPYGHRASDAASDAADYRVDHAHGDALAVVSWC